MELTNNGGFLFLPTPHPIPTSHQLRPDLQWRSGRGFLHPLLSLFFIPFCPVGSPELGMGEQGRRNKKLLSYLAGVWLVLFAVFPWHLSCPLCHPGVLQRYPMGNPAVYSVLIYFLIFSLKSCLWWAPLSLLVLGFSCHDGKPSWVLIK